MFQELKSDNSVGNYRVQLLSEDLVNYHCSEFWSMNSTDSEQSTYLGWKQTV
jgi:hypothetical protein